MSNTPQLDLYAFWEYSEFPYILAGPVSKLHENGDVETANYGPGFRFKPVKLLPREAGAQLHGALKTLEKAHEAAQKKFHSEWKAKVEEQLGRLR